MTHWLIVLIPGISLADALPLLQFEADPNTGGTINIGAITVISGFIAVVGLLIGTLRYIAKENERNRTATETAHKEDRRLADEANERRVTELREDFQKQLDNTRTDCQRQITELRTDYQQRIADLQAQLLRAEKREDDRTVVNKEMLDTFKEAVQIMRIQTDIAQKTTPSRRRSASDE